MFFARDSSDALFPSCTVKHVFYILSCSDWSQSNCTDYLLFNLFKGLLLLRASQEIILLHYLMERSYNKIIIWDMHSPETHSTKETLGFFCSLWWRYSSGFLTVLLAALPRNGREFSSSTWNWKSCGKYWRLLGIAVCLFLAYLLLSHNRCRYSGDFQELGSRKCSSLALCSSTNSWLHDVVVWNTS